MNNKWKIAAITSLLLTPAIVVHADNSTNSITQLSAAENRAILYFSQLHIDSSLIDQSVYDELLNNAYADRQDPRRLLLEEKLAYIKGYKSLTLTADSLKTEIAKLTTNNQNLYEEVKNALVKYEAISNELVRMNDRLFNAKSAVQDAAYLNVLSNISNYYENNDNGVTITLVDVLAKLIGASNQQTLLTRSIQVQNVFEKTHSFAGGPSEVTYAQLVDMLNNVNVATLTASNYKTMLANVKTAYATLSVDEKKIADAQALKGTSLTFKQVVSNAETNIAKAEVVDAEIRKFESLDANPTSAAGIDALKKQLLVIDQSYNSLSELQKKLLSPYSNNLLAPFVFILNIAGEMGALKIENGDQYRNAIQRIETLMAKLPDELTQLAISMEVAKEIMPNIEKYNQAKVDIEKADLMEIAITELVINNGVVPSIQDIQNLRASFNALTANQKKLVRNQQLITVWENAEKRAANVDKLINAIVVSEKQEFYKRFEAAWKAYEELNPTIERLYLKKEARLKALQFYANIVNRYNALVVTDSNYAEDIAALLKSIATIDNAGTIIWNNEWTDRTIDTLPSLTPQDIEALKQLRLTLLDRRNSSEIANDLVTKIDQLGQVAPDQLLATLVNYRAEYNRLDATAKKLVTNINKLTLYEKEYVAAIKVVKQITSLDPIANDFTKKAVAARKAYDTLPNAMRPYVANTLVILQEYERISNVMLQIENLQKSKNILEDVTGARREYDRLVNYLNNVPSNSVLLNQALEILDVLNNNYYSMLIFAVKRDESVKDLVEAIERLSINYTLNVGGAIEQVAIAYKALSSNDKKLVGNYNLFKIVEKNYKAAQKVYTMIENLPAKEASNYAKEIEKALDAYRKLSEEQRKYVFNYADKLQPFVKVAAIIGDIEALKPTMKDYALVVQQIRARYNELTMQEKQQVYNYNKLEAAENAILGVQNVMKLINDAKPGLDKYIEALQKAREAYDTLSKDQQKQVTNYADLQSKENAVKPVLDLNNQILKIEIQRTSKNFIKEYDNAWKKYDTISLQDRKLLTNEKILIEVLPPLYNVMFMIDAIKGTSNAFVSDVEAARAAYNALTEEQKEKILNVATLEEHEINVRGGAYVDELIRAIRTQPKELYVIKVQEALAAYKNLSATNKKAVTLYEDLKLEEKFIKPVVAAISAIDTLTYSVSKVDVQVKKLQGILSKLSDEQYELIYNIDQYNALENVITTINLIEQIKPSDTKYYIGNTKAAEIAYNRLSPNEKQRVSNYSKLEEALVNVSALDQLISKINELSYLSTTFEADISTLLGEYKKLPSALKKQVINYHVLEKANKDLAAAKKVIAAIANIDPSVRTFEAKVLAARKLFIALDDTQKALVSNLRLLEQYERQLGI